MSILANPLDECRLDMRRFYTDDGDPISCWEAVERILKPFNVVLKQHKGKYKLTNPHELDSPVWEFDWDTLSQINSANPINYNVISVMDRKVDLYIEQQKIKPLKSTSLKLRSKDLGEDVTGRDLSRWMTVWTKNFYSTSIKAAPDDKALQMYSTNYKTDNGNNTLYLSAPISLGKMTDGDFLSLEFTYMLDSYRSQWMQYTPSIQLVVEVQHPNGEWREGRRLALYSSSWTTYSNIQDVNLAFKLSESGKYNIRFTVVCDPTNPTWFYDNMMWSIKDVKISMAAKTIHDIEYIQGLNTTSIAKQSNDVYIWDAPQITFLGALLKYDEAAESWITTDKWNSYGNTEEIKLLDLYSRNLLNNRFKYKNFLRITLYDRENIIDLDSILIIDGRYYVWTNFKRDYHLGSVSGDLIELMTTRQTYSPIRENVLKTINGKEITT